MTKNEQTANVIAFLAILFGENNEVWNEIMNLTPDYIIEKFDRYILSMRTEYPWGMHPSLRSMRFNRYLDKWGLELKENE